MFFELFVSNGRIALHSFNKIMALLCGLGEILEGVKKTAAFYLPLAIRDLLVNAGQNVIKHEHVVILDPGIRALNRDQVMQLWT